MRKFSLAVAVVALLAVTACGGSSDNGTGTTANPTATSAKTIAADMKAVNMAYQAYSQIAPVVFGGAAQVVKVASSSEIDVLCSDTSSASFSCTATDSSGGTCTVTGSATEATYTFEMTFDCTNFHPDSDTTTDGAFTASVIYHADAAAMTTKNSGSLKLISDKTTGDECTISDEDTSIYDGMCTESGTCSTDSANLLVRLEFTVGSRGLRLVDLCGTYEYDAGFNMSTNLCMTEGTTDMIMNFAVDGTLNGEAASFEQTWTCDFGSL